MRAFGPAAEIADQYMDQVNLRALANQENVLQSHRGGTGELRYTDVQIVDASGRATALVRDGGPLVVRAYDDAGVRVAAPGVQVAIVDVDTGLVVATAVSSPADVPPVVEGSGCSNASSIRSRCADAECVLRMTITDSYQLVSATS